MAIPVLGTPTNTVCLSANSNFDIPPHTAGDAFVIVAAREGFNETEPSLTISTATKIAEFGSTDSVSGSRHNLALFTWTGDGSTTQMTLGMGTSDTGEVSVYPVTGADDLDILGAMAVNGEDRGNFADQFIYPTDTTSANALAVVVFAPQYQADLLVVGPASDAGWTRHSYFQAQLSAVGQDVYVFTKEMASIGSPGALEINNGAGNSFDGAVMWFAIKEDPGNSAGTGDLSLPAFTTSGFGSEVDITGAGTPTLPALTISGAGVVSVSGSSGLTLPAFAVSAVIGEAAATASGAGALTLPALTSGGAGAQVSPSVSGSASMTMQPFVIRAGGITENYDKVVSGAGSISRKGDFDITLSLPNNLITRFANHENTNRVTTFFRQLRVTGSISNDGTIEFTTDPIPQDLFSVEVAQDFWLDELVVEAPTAEAPPAVTGTPQVGRQLNATVGSWTGFGVSAYAFQWKRDGSPISGATRQNYVVTSDDDGAKITVEVTATNPAGGTTSASQPVSVNFSGPTLVVTPQISGTTTIGQTLTCSTGTWSGGGIAYTYQWKRNGVAISGATASTYTLAGADDLATITCTVTATNTGGAQSSTAPGVSVTYAAPTLAGSIADQTYDENSGIKYVSFSGVFSGSDLTYATTTSQAGVTVDSGGLRLVIDTGLTGALSAVVVTLQATNSGGGTTAAFQLTVQADQVAADTEYDAAIGLSPLVLFDDENNVFRLNGATLDSQWDVFENEVATAPSDMAMVIDQDGNLKWPMHSLDPRAGSGATSFSLTMEAGRQHTVAFVGTGTVTLSGGATATINGGGASAVTAQNIVPTGNVSVSLSGTVDQFHAYRSDGGGMQAIGPAGNPTYLEAPSGPRFTLGRAYGAAESGGYVGVPHFEAASNEMPYPNPQTNWGSPWNDTGATSSSDSLRLFGIEAWSGRRVVSGGQEWHRIDTQGGSPLLSLTSGVPVAFSVVYDPGTSGKVMFQIRESVTTNTSRLGGPISGVEEVLSEAGAFSNATDVGYGGGRVLYCTFTPNATGNYEIGFGPFSTTSGEYATLAYVQFESRAVPTSLMPFGARKVSAPTLSYAATGLPSDGVTIMVEAVTSLPDQDTTTRALVSVDDGDANDQIAVLIDAESDQVEATVKSGGAQTASLASATAAPLRTAFTYKSDDASLVADSGTVSRDTTVALPTPTTIRLGHTVSGQYLNGYIAKLGMWPGHINHSDLKGLTLTGMPGTSPAVPTRPANTVAPQATGTPAAGNTISASLGTWTGTEPQTYTYQWRKDQAPISGETGTTYVTRNPDDIGGVITCEVQATNEVGTASAVSNGVTVTDPADIPLPVNNVRPVLTGSAALGSSLLCSTGSWTWMDEVHTPSYAYQWHRDDVAISGATSSTYITVSADVGGAITCRVTATNAAGSTVVASSNSIVVTEQSTDFAKMSPVPAKAMTDSSKWAGSFVGDIGWSALLTGAQIVEMDDIGAHQPYNQYTVPEYNGGTTISDVMSCRPRPEGTISVGGPLIFGVPMFSGRVRMRNRFPHLTRGNMVFAGHMAPAPGIEFYGQQLFVAGQNMWLDGFAARPDRQAESESVARNVDGLAIRSYEAGSRDLGNTDAPTQYVVISHVSVAGSADEGITFKPLNGNEIRRVTLREWLMFQPLDNPGRDADERPHTLAMYFQKGTFLVDAVNGAIIGHRERGPKIEGGHLGVGVSVAVNGVLTMCFNDGGAMRSDLARNRGDSVRQSGMNVNLYDYADGDLKISATRCVGLWPSDRFFFDHPSGNSPTSGYVGAFGRGKSMGSDGPGNYQVYRHESDCFMRDYSMNDPLVASQPGRTFSSLPWWNNVTDATTEVVSKNNSWDPNNVSGNLSDVERFVSKYAGKFPANRDGIDELTWSIAFDPAQNRLLPRLDRLPGPNGTNWEDHSYPYTVRTTPHNYPDDPWEIVGNVPRIFLWYEENYRKPAGCVPLFADNA